MTLIVDEECYRTITNYIPGKEAIQKARYNMVT